MSSQAEGKPKGKTGALRTMVTAFRKPAIRREQTQESLRDENGAKNNPASTHVTVHQVSLHFTTCFQDSVDAELRILATISGSRVLPLKQPGRVAKQEATSFIQIS